MNAAHPNMTSSRARSKDLKAGAATGLHNLQNPNRTYPRRVGRGTGSGSGTTAGRGTKGQNARSGGGVRPRFEGGHTPLYRLTPKLRGFTSRFEPPVTINVSDLSKHFAQGGVVRRSDLIAKGLVAASTKQIKLLGDGEINAALTVYVTAASGSATAKIEKAGGKVMLPKAARRPATTKTKKG